jgi:hypothetical protein
MSTSLEQAYGAVEQAYAAADFQAALETAEALLPQIPRERDDQLQQRLQLLIGHIHLYGLQQPGPAATAYRAVLEHCQEPGYRTLAQEGLLQAAQPTAPVASAPLAAATDQPATPWLEALRPSTDLSPAPQADATPAPQAATPQQQQAPDPYDQGLLLVELQGRPSELDQP